MKCDKSQQCYGEYKTTVTVHDDGNQRFIEYKGVFWMCTGAADLQTIQDDHRIWEDVQLKELKTINPQTTEEFWRKSGIPEHMVKHGVYKTEDEVVKFLLDHDKDIEKSVTQTKRLME